MTQSPLFADLVDHIGELTALRIHLEQETEDILFFCLDQTGHHVASVGFPLETNQAIALSRKMRKNLRKWLSLFRAECFFC
jgi:two-component system, sensor histidine kinase and response regulator